MPSFSAARFLYERLVGAEGRPWLPAAFCAAAALPTDGVIDQFPAAYVVARQDGRTVGVVCAEHVGTVRAWTPLEQPFASRCTCFSTLP